MKLINDKRFFLIDSFIYIYKYYYYYKKYYNNKSIIIGFTNFIINILILKKPTHIIVVFDGKLEKSYKKKLFNKYKLNRKKPPFNFKENVLIIKKLLNLFKIIYIAPKYVEADDIIGSIIKKSEKRGYTNYIYTEDRDFYQLVSNRTFILKKNLIIDVQYILKNFNISNINQYVDLISLTGDKSDNIPGIPNVGLKTANILLKNYNNLKNIFLNINNIKPYIKKKIKNHKKIAILSHKLIKINKNLKIKKNIFIPRQKINSKIAQSILFNIDYKIFNKKINQLKKISFI